MSESISTIMRRMNRPKDISGDDDGGNEMLRVDTLADLQEFTHFAVEGNHVLIRTNKGRCLVEKREVHGAPMVGFVYQEHNKSESIAFWYNANSVEFLGPLLRNNPGKRVSMQRLIQE